MVQDGCAHVQGHSWNCAVIPESTGSCCVADLPGRRSLRSARTNRLLVPSVKLSTVGGPTIWNSLPDSVISAPSLSTFRQRLKTFLFQASFPDIITDPW